MPLRSLAWIFWLLASATTTQDPDVAIRIASKLGPAVVEIKTTQGSGSGFLVDSLGVIVTNHHVSEAGDVISVTLANGDVYNTINKVADDSLRDISILRVPGFNLAQAKLGDSESVQVGQKIFVIGNPLGLQNSLTDGIVSAVRQFDGVRLFQISAPISPGSSGSPVVNTEGEVIAIAVAKWRGGENLNFAIPINYARGLISLSPGTPATTPNLKTSVNSWRALSGSWVSIATGLLLEIREDGDRLYIESIYPATQKEKGASNLFDLQKVAESRYQGVQHFRNTCVNGFGVVFPFTIDAPVELNRISENRLEGRHFWPNGKWDMCRGNPSDNDRVWEPLIWTRK